MPAPFAALREVLRPALNPVVPDDLEVRINKREVTPRPYAAELVDAIENLERPTPR